MRTAPETVMAFPNLDQAESALDWIGLEFREGRLGDSGWFEGVLDGAAADLLDAAIEEGETPLPVRALATVLREGWRTEPSRVAWRVTFPAD